MSTFVYEGPYPSRRSPVFARNIISASQPLSAQAGLAMLMRGGNAVDAVIAAGINHTVVEPPMTGVGSDAFAIVWDGKELHGLNASGRSPKNWSLDRFKDRKAMPGKGWDAVTTPGAVAAWVDLSKRFGKLPFDALFEPAIRNASKGFYVTPAIGTQWRAGAENLKDVPGFAEGFMRDGRAPAAGELFRNEALAASLAAIAESKGESFYRGDLAKRIVAFAKEHGGALDEDDLASHENVWCGTISAPFRGSNLHEIPPNGQGVSALMALGILEAFDLENMDPDGVEANHLLIEALKLAFADAQAYIADPDFMKRVSAKDLLDKDYLKGRAKLIDRKKAQDFGPGSPRKGGTIYVTAADESGMVASYIQSAFTGFGSGITVPGTGINFHSRGLGFSLDPAHPNVVGPSKRPFHTIIPAFVMREGKPFMSLGCVGGSMQAQGHVQMMTRTHCWKQDVQTSVDAPRWRVNEGLSVSAENSMPAKLADGLAALGHAMKRDGPINFGSVQMLQSLGGGGWAAGSDPRRDGQAVGF